MKNARISSTAVLIIGSAVRQKRRGKYKARGKRGDPQTHRGRRSITTVMHASSMYEGAV